MIKIGNAKFETTQISQCNLTGLYPRIYLLQRLFDICPICGKNTLGYVYAVQVNEKECVKIHGKSCSKCCAFFSDCEKLVVWAYKHNCNCGSFSICYKYNRKIDFVKYSNIFRHKTSAFLQYVLIGDSGSRVFTVVWDSAQIDYENGVVLFDDPIGRAILLHEETGYDNHIELDDNHLIVVIKKKREIQDSEALAKIQEFQRHIRTQHLIETGKISLSSENKLYIYQGNISCHSKHTVIEFRAEIPLFDANKAMFFVEYCSTCGRFLMKYQDYRVYLQRFGLFPMKVTIENTVRDYLNRAEFSPLRINGYNVNAQVGYSAKVRQQKLAFFMDHGVLDKRKMLDYLEQFIKDNEHRIGQEMAVLKWREDLEFVLNYKLSKKPAVLIGKIELRR